MNLNLSRILTTAAVGLLASACVSGGGGGGGGFAGVGGPEGTTCDKSYLNQGCYGSSAMQCDPGSNTWKKISDCLPPTACIEDAVPGGNTKTATCKATSTTTGSDATSGGDSTTTKDTSGGGSDVSVQVILSCMQSKCSSQWGACQANANCKSTLDCMIACGGTCDAQTCIKTSDQVALSLFSAVGSCGQTSGCLGSTPICGNGKCESGETASSCFSDCGTEGPVCGNGSCESGESNSSCPQDCKTAVAVCGNGKCETGETKSSCPSDCGTTTCTPNCSGAYCGDSDGCTGKCSGPCSNGGTCTSNKTCSAPKPVCGNGTCESGETASSCASDCGGGGGDTCGDLVCGASENVNSCAQDCDPATICIMNACGDSVMTCFNDAKCGSMYQCVANCNGDNTCAQGCASTAGSAATNLFSAMATCINNSGCAGGGTAQCGNGACESGETAASCPSDCGGGGGGHFCDANCGNGGTGCYCDASCKQYGDCCNAAGNAPGGKTCAGSTCTQCK